jgi:hypothetical protein
MLYAAKARGRLAQCRSELACLAQALAEYQRDHGDFPLAGATADESARRLHAALAELPGAPAAPVAGAGPGAEGTAFVDPWGNAYVYSYRSAPGAEWRPAGVILFSAGPDGRNLGPDAAGRFEGGRRGMPVNADNVYADEAP